MSIKEKGYNALSVKMQLASKEQEARELLKKTNVPHYLIYLAIMGRSYGFDCIIKLKDTKRNEAEIIAPITPWNPIGSIPNFYESLEVSYTDRDNDWQVLTVSSDDRELDDFRSEVFQLREQVIAREKAQEKEKKMVEIRRNAMKKLTKEEQEAFGFTG